MTRVSDRVMFETSLHFVQRAQQRVENVQLHASTGLRVMGSGDDPVAASKGILLGAEKARLDAMARVAVQARAELGTADSALETADGVVQRARELAVLGSNGTMGTAERTILSIEVGHLREVLLGAANANVAGVYIFGGSQVNTAPFDAIGNFLGDNASRTLEVAPGISANVGGVGGAAFTAAGGQDIFGLLSSLETALATNNVAAISGTLPNFDTAQTQISVARAGVGHNLEQVEAASGLRERLQLDVADAKSATIEYDQIQSYMDLVQAQQAMQAAIAQATRILAGIAPSQSA